MVKNLGIDIINKDKDFLTLESDPQSYYPN